MRAPLAVAAALLSRWERMAIVAYLRTYVTQTSIPGFPFYMLRMAPLYTRGPAGARNFVRRATRRLVERFYINLWTKDMSKLDALREAQLWLLKHPDEIRNISLAGDESRAHMFGLGGTRVEWIKPRAAQACESARLDTHRGRTAELSLCPVGDATFSIALQTLSDYSTYSINQICRLTPNFPSPATNCCDRIRCEFKSR